MSEMMTMGSDERLSVEAGDIISLGDYYWQVLDVQNGRALVLSEKVIERRRYNESFIGITWETSTVRQYLNGEFYDKFST